jgi:hypothetical protein
MGWLLHFLGVDTETGHAYAWWSGAGSDIGELAIIGGLAAMLRKHQCHQKGCIRIGRHTVDGTPWCNRHHQAQRDGGDGGR